VTIGEGGGLLRLALWLGVKMNKDVYRSCRHNVTAA
jgi:hypothetical protein